MRRFVLSVFIWSALWVNGQVPETASGSAGAPVYRYLIVLDTSAAMSRQKEVAIDTVHKLILSGLSGRVRVGDILGIWTFAEQLDTKRFPARVWAPQQAQDLANGVYRTLIDLKPANKARMDGVVRALREVAAASGSLTVFLITDGSTPVKGTPFDSAINDIFRKHASGMRKAKKPFVIVFAAHEGRLIAHAVSPAGGPIYIPPTPAMAKSEQRTNEPPTKSQGSPPIQNASERKVPNPDAGRVAPPKTNSVRPLTVAEIEARLKGGSTSPTNLSGSANVTPAPPAPTVASSRLESNPPPTSLVPETTKPSPAPATPTAPVANLKSEGLAATTPGQILDKNEKPAAPRGFELPASNVTVSSNASVVATPPLHRDPSAPSESLPIPATQVRPEKDRVVGTHNPTTETTNSTSSPAAQQTGTVTAPVPANEGSRILWPGATLLVAAGALGWLLARSTQPRPRRSLISSSMDNRKR